LVIGMVTIDQAIVISASGTVVEQKLAADVSVIRHEQD